MSALNKMKSSVQEYHHKQSWLQIIRPLTLTGSISPIIVGTIVASTYGPIQHDMVAMLMIAVVITQAAINILNDYFDFTHGQDQDRWYIPGFGEEKHAGPPHSKLPLIAGIMLIFSSGLGLWIAMNSHQAIIFIGIIGILAGYKYSAGGHYSLSALGLGELTAALFLGIVPVFLAFLVQHQSVSWLGFAIATIFGILISTMILTNNIRDLDKDQTFRKTIAIRIGKKRAVLLLAILSISVYVIVTGLVISQFLPWSALLVYLATPLAYRLLMAFRKNATRTEELRGMKLAAQHHWLFSILLIIGLCIGL